MKRKSIVTYFLLALITVTLVISVLVFLLKNKDENIKVVKSEKELINIVKNKKDINIVKSLFTLPYSIFYNSFDAIENVRYSTDVEYSPTMNTKGASYETNSANGTISKTTDYSKTNIQVENVDEADIVKTDGEYIYSVADDKVIITKVLDDGSFEVISNITNIGVPEDILINKVLNISDRLEC